MQDCKINERGRKREGRREGERGRERETDRQRDGGERERERERGKWVDVNRGVLSVGIKINGSRLLNLKCE